MARQATRRWDASADGSRRAPALSDRRCPLGRAAARACSCVVDPRCRTAVSSAATTSSRHQDCMPRVPTTVASASPRSASTPRHARPSSRQTEWCGPLPRTSPAGRHSRASTTSAKICRLILTTYDHPVVDDELFGADDRGGAHAALGNGPKIDHGAGRSEPKPVKLDTGEPRRSVSWERSPRRLAASTCARRAAVSGLALGRPRQPEAGPANSGRGSAPSRQHRQARPSEPGVDPRNGDGPDDRVRAVVLKVTRVG